MAYNQFTDDAPEQQVIGTPLHPQLKLICDQIDQAVTKFNGQVGLFESKTQQMQRCKNPTEMPELKKQLNDILSNVKQTIVPQINGRVADLQRNVNALKLTTQQKQQGQQIANKYQQLQKTKVSQLSKLQTITSKLNSRIDEEAKQEDPQQAVQNFKMNLMTEEMNTELDEIKNINQQMGDIRSLIGVMADNVQQQQETINVIKNNVVTADRNVSEGVEHLQKAKKQQKSKNKWLFWGLGAVAIVTIILLCVFLI